MVVGYGNSTKKLYLCNQNDYNLQNMDGVTFIYIFIGIVTVVAMSIIFSTPSKKVEKKQEALSTEIDKSQSIEEAQKQLTDIKNKVAEIRKMNENITEQNKINDASECSVPMANYRLDDLRKHNQILETAKTPEILSNCLSMMEDHIEWFIEQEIEGSKAHWLLVGGANNMLKKVRDRYNTMIYRLAEEAFNDYAIKIKEVVSSDMKDELTTVTFEEIDRLRGWVNTKADNYEECFTELNELHDKVEVLYSDNA